jgi:hypothetical protein
VLPEIENLLQVNVREQRRAIYLREEILIAAHYRETPKIAGLFPERTNTQLTSQKVAGIMTPLEITAATRCRPSMTTPGVPPR